MGKTGEYTTTRMGGLKHLEMNICCRQYEGESCRMNGPLMTRGYEGLLGPEMEQNAWCHWIYPASFKSTFAVCYSCLPDSSRHLLVVYHFGGRATTPHTKGQLVLFAPDVFVCPAPSCRTLENWTLTSAPHVSKLCSPSSIAYGAQSGVQALLLMLCAIWSTKKTCVPIGDGNQYNYS